MQTGFSLSGSPKDVAIVVEPKQRQQSQSRKARAKLWILICWLRDPNSLAFSLILSPHSSFFLCCCYQSDDDKARLERAAAAAGTGSLKCGLDLMSERAARLILCVCVCAQPDCVSVCVCDG